MDFLHKITSFNVANKNSQNLRERKVDVMSIMLRVHDFCHSPGCSWFRGSVARNSVDQQVSKSDVSDSLIQPALCDLFSSRGRRSSVDAYGKAKWLKTFSISTKLVTHEQTRQILISKCLILTYFLMLKETQGFN